MIVLFLVLVWYTWLNRSTLGASFRAIKVNESKMKFLGYNNLCHSVDGFYPQLRSGCSCRAMFAVNYGFVNPSITAPDARQKSCRHPARGPEALWTLLRHRSVHRTPRCVSTFVSRGSWLWILTIIVCFKFKGGVWGTFKSSAASSED